MCSVIGYVSDNPKKKDLDFLKLVWKESKIRGLHAFGFSYLDDGKIITIKKSNIEEIVDQMELAFPFNKMIGHCRYSTSGDWEVEKNNQPIHIGSTSLVFNGVISMKTKKEYQKEYGEKYETDNDGEIVLKMFQRGGADCAQFVFESKFSFAGMILSPESLYVLRNDSRPLWTSEREGAKFFASTSDILARAGSTWHERVPSRRMFKL